jgi:hypothetical protein
MRAALRSQQMAKMPLAEHDNVAKTFPADRTDRPFTISVLPRRSRRGWPIPNAHRPKAADEDVTVDGGAVTNDVSRRRFPTIGLGELVRNPSAAPHWFDHGPVFTPRSSNRTGRFPASGSRTKLHAFTHGTSCPSRLKRTSPKCPYEVVREVGVDDFRVATEQQLFHLASTKSITQFDSTY